jgi:hypothetical protein
MFIISIYISKKWGTKVWTGFSWLVIRPVVALEVSVLMTA